MTVIEIENNLNNLVANFSKESFVYELLLAYGTPKSTIKRLQGSDHDRLEADGETVVRKKLFFKVTHSDLHATIDQLKSSKDVTKHSPRFIIVTDYETFLAYDTKTDDSLDTELLNIVNHYDFFLPLAGMEKATFQNENPADVKASLKMARLYDELQKNNNFETKEDIHSLNVFLTRLLFCYFAEDTNIFEDNIFTSSISSHTQLDGSDLDSYLQRLFSIFNTPQNSREPNTPAYLNVFPYVNGGLFAQEVKLPIFTTRSRHLLIEVGQLQWSQINPDIFGSMIQAVVTPEHRGGMGMHYTSVPNIMKVIEPLFLDELYTEFEKAYESKTKLQNLLDRLSTIKIFDPACGSGNFLIIAYKKLRELEMSIFKRINTLSKERSFQFSEIKLTQFYGIELDDFAHEVALLSLWLAEHQMNLKFYEEFGRTSPSLPLHDGGNIVHANATRINWEEVCPKNEGDEIYVLGNPPYLGYSDRNLEQKEDMNFVFDNSSNIQRLDYIGCWFKKATDYISNINLSQYAFVSTNSISQGEQVSLIWPYIFEKEQEIKFAYQSFSWTNNAKDRAGVTVVIIGIGNISQSKKYIYNQNIKYEVKNISPYLIEASNTIMTQRKTSISNFPEMVLGSSGIDGGHLILTPDEKDLFIDADKRSTKFIKQFIGGADFLRGINRYCLWIEDNDVKESYSIPIIKERIDKCREYRQNAGRDAKKAADVPHRFFYRKHKDEDAIILPMTSSSRREYLPIGYSTTHPVISNGVFIIYSNALYMLGVLSSKLHNIWTSITSARMRNDYRYSVNLTYNTFPFPNISQKQKDEITELVFTIIDEREKHSQKTLAQLYDPNKMPEGLQKAHQALDKAIEQCYRPKPFESDEERLEYLFRMYEEMASK
jgi:hypothetical protein